MTHNLGNDVRSLETRVGLGTKEYRAWCPIDTMRPSEIIGTEQHGRADLGFCEAVSARRSVIRDDDGVFLGGTGTVSRDTIRLFLIGLPALAAGTWAGLKLFGRLDEVGFRRVVLGLLLVSGVSLLLHR
jgi:hypothetical protein